MTDLYVVGRQLTFDDGAGEPVVVWIQKLNPVTHETALRHANAARARALAVRSDKHSSEYAVLESEAIEMARDDRLVFLLADEEVRVRPVVEAECAAEEEWEKDNYLQGLTDAWAGGLSERYVDDTDDAEALRVYGELTRFAEGADKRVETALAGSRRDLEALSDDALQDKVLERALQMRADMAWLSEYRRCEVWLSVREADRKSRYFNHRAEVDELSREIFTELSSAYHDLSVEVVEGKDSQEALTSSPSSDSPDKGATGQPSGQEEAAA